MSVMGQNLGFKGESTRGRLGEQRHCSQSYSGIGRLNVKYVPLYMYTKQFMDIRKQKMAYVLYK
jgi:hypothetical protein